MIYPAFLSLHLNLGNRIPLFNIVPEIAFRFVRHAIVYKHHFAVLAPLQEPVFGIGIRKTLFIIVTLLLAHVVINIHIVPPSRFSITILSPSGDHQCPIYSLFGYDTRYSPLLLSALRTMYEYPPRTHGRLLLPVPMARLYSVMLHSPPGAVSRPII